MPRKPRLFVSGGIYHVYCRTHRGEMRFNKTCEGQFFLEVLKAMSSAHKLSILAFVVMSNHYHLALRTGDVMLWRSMASVHSRITREHNRRHRVFGPGWQSRYRARLVQDDDDLRNLLAYIHLNPVAAGLVDDPAEYPLSGHQELLGRKGPWLIDIQSALRCFGEKTTDAARRAYLQYLRAVAEAKWARSTLRHLPWWKKVKDDYQIVDFENAPSDARTFHDAHPELPLSPKESLETLLRRTCRILGVSCSEITGQERKQSARIARQRFAFIAVSHFRHRGVSVAKAMQKSPCQVSRWLSAQTAACSRDPSEADLIEIAVVELLKPRPVPEDLPC